MQKFFLHQKKAVFMLLAIVGGGILAALTFLLHNEKPIPYVDADVPSSSSSDGEGDCDAGSGGGDC